MKEKLTPGSIGWIDLTVENADELKDFYTNVVGWKAQEVSMGDYNDYNMVSPETGMPSSGICHKRGGNKAIPSVWMIYFIVSDMDHSLAMVKDRGGKVIIEPKHHTGQGKYAVIEDPAGVHCALFEQE